MPRQGYNPAQDVEPDTDPNAALLAEWNRHCAGHSDPFQTKEGRAWFRGLSVEAQDTLIDLAWVRRFSRLMVASPEAA